MKSSKHIRLTGVPLAGALLVGCAAAPAPMAQLAFDRVQMAAPPSAIVPASPTTAAAPQLAPSEAAHAAPVSSGRGGGGSQQAPSGHQLRIDLRGFLASFRAPAQRRLLATTADIDKLVLTVMQPDQPDQTATLTREQLTSGVADFTFDGLPAGHAIVFVIAYDAAGLPIGSASQVVVISETTSSVADMTVQLVPSSATSGPGGTLITKTTFLDGPAPSTVPAGTVLMELDTMGIPHSLTPAPGGGMFVGTHLMATQPMGNIFLAFFNAVVRVAGDGTKILEDKGPHAAPATYAYSPTTGQLWATWRGSKIIEPDGTGTGLYFNARSFILDAAGNAYGAEAFQNEGPIYKVTPAGERTETSMSSSGAMTFDTAGHLWTAWADGASVATTLRRYAPDETLVGTYTVPGPVRRIVAAPSGDLWVIHAVTGADTSHFAAEVGPPSSQISKLSADGTLLGTYDVSASQLAFDAQGNVWAAGEQLTKLSPDGEVLASYPQECWSVAVDDLGYVWIGAKKDNGMAAVKKLQP